MFTEYLLTQAPPQTDTLSGFCLAFAVPLPEVGAHLVADVPLFKERPSCQKNPEYLLDQSSCSWTLPTSNPITSLRPHPCFRLPARTYQTPPTFLLCLSPLQRRDADCRINCPAHLLCDLGQVHSPLWISSRKWREKQLHQATEDIQWMVCILSLS